MTVWIRNSFEYGIWGVMKAFYEKDPEVAEAIQKSYRAALNGKAKTALLFQCRDEFREDLDLEMMYKDMYWAAEGYLWEAIQQGRWMQKNWKEIL